MITYGRQYGSGIGYQPDSEIVYYRKGRRDPNTTVGNTEILKELPNLPAGEAGHYFYNSTFGRFQFIQLFGLSDIITDTRNASAVRSITFPNMLGHTFFAMRDMLSFFSNKGYPARPVQLKGIKEGGVASYFDCLLFAAFNSKHVVRAAFSKWQIMRDDYEVKVDMSPQVVEDNGTDCCNLDDVRADIADLASTLFNIEVAIRDLGANQEVRFDKLGSDVTDLREMAMEHGKLLLKIRANTSP